MKENKTELTKLVDIIDTLDISDEQRKEMRMLTKRIDREQRVTAFKVERSVKDKTIVANVLNTTIMELEAQKKLVEEQSKQLKSSLWELERSYNEVEQFSYIASHDLKSPLRTISNFAQLLQRRYYGKLDKEADEFINFIISGAQHMNTIICDLLEYSRVGNSSKGMDYVKMTDVLELAELNLREYIRENDARIVISDPLPDLKLNKSSMVQLFQNLIGNAIKFRGEEKPVIIIGCQKKENDNWEFRVKDNGVGMDEEYQAKAFLPFQRLNNQDRPGTGIGLAICKKAVKMHSGEIRYESTKGEGTTFVFTIPQFNDGAAMNEGMKQKPAGE